jgi:ABC-type transporter Mla subunit MlaD
MAFEYQSYASLGLNLNRQKYGPLDISNVFTSENDLKYYLTKGAHTEGVSEYWTKITPYPYEGQVLATVIGGVVNVYVLALNGVGEFITQEIAGKIEVDGKTIVKDADGTLSIVAPTNPDDTKTYNFAYANGVYSWVEVDTATAAGQAQAIQGLTDRTVAIEEAINGKGEGGSHVAGLIEKVSDNAQAIVDEAAARAEAVDELTEAIGAPKQGETAASGVYAAVEAAVASANAYADSADTELSGRITDLEVAINGAENVDGLEARVEAMETFWDATTDNDGIVNKLKEIQDYIASDESGAAAMAGNINANAVAITKLNGDTSIEGSVASKIAKAVSDIEAKGYAVATNVAATYVTKTELTTHEEEISNELKAYAKNEYITAALAAKIETGTIAHTTDELAEGVTVTGTALNIVVDAYTKAETLAQIEEIFESINDNSESANSVNTKLENHLKTYEEKVGQIDTKNGEQDSAIAAAKDQADKGVADAAKVAGDLATANLAIANNAREIDVAKSSIETVNTTLSEKITALENADTKFTSDIVTIQGVVSGENGHAARIAALEALAVSLETKDTEFAAQIQGNTAKFADYYTSTQVDTKVKEVSDAVAAIDLEPFAKIEDMVAALAPKANAADVYTKDAADAAFMTQDEVDARINALIVAADPEGGKTIENIQNLVKYVDDNAGDIAGLLTTVDNNTTAIEKNASDITKINSAIAALIQPKASTEVTIAEDGTLGIGEVNVNKLVQTAGDVLILSGGHA